MMSGELEADLQVGISKAILVAHKYQLLRFTEVDRNLGKCTAGCNDQYLRQTALETQKRGSYLIHSDDMHEVVC